MKMTLRGERMLEEKRFKERNLTVYVVWKCSGINY